MRDTTPRPPEAKHLEAWQKVTWLTGYKPDRRVMAEEQAQQALDADSTKTPHEQR